MKFLICQQKDQSFQRDRGKLVNSPNSTWLVTSRLDTARRVERVEPCCSNMADGEQAIVLACTSFVVFVLLHIQIYLFRQKR